MAVFRNLFKDIDGIFETKFENVTIVEGTDYESGYKDGYSEGEKVGRELGYSDGLSDGENAAKNKLSVLSVTDNGNYLPKDGEIGFKEVKVSVKTQPSQGSYEDGYNDGYQKGLSEGYENGYNEGSSEGYNVGYTNGRSDALAQLKELVVKENGEYLPQDGIGFNKVMVSVEGSDCDCFTVTLSEDGIIEMHNPPHNYETGYDLYTADEVGYTIDLVSRVSSDSETSWDVSSHLMGGNSYVAIAKIWGSGGTLEYSSKSHTISVPVKVTLSENGVANIPNVDFDEADFHLYDAETNSLVQFVDLTRFPIDLSEYMEVGKSYYVVVRNTMDVTNLDVVSNTIIYTDQMWYFDHIDDWAREYLSISGGFLIASGEPWYVEDEDGIFINELYYEQPLDLSTLDKSKTYYVMDGHGGGKSATLKYGTPPEIVWLFKDEYFSDWRTDLPAPTTGVSYTCFINGELISANTYEEGSSGMYFDRFVSDNSGDIFYVFIYEEDMGWGFHPMDSSISSGYVSIAING